MPRGDARPLIKHQWKKGQSGNPKGRPKKLPDLKEVLISVLAETKEGKMAIEAILMAMRSKALKGDVRAAELLLDRGYGKAKQEHDVLAHFTNVIMPLPPANPTLEITGTEFEPQKERRALDAHDDSSELSE
jgi:hypothetical protein